MSAITLRNLSYNAHIHEPDTEPAHREWWVEQIIELAHSTDEPHWLGLIRDWLRPDLCDLKVGEMVTGLLDLADEIAETEGQMGERARRRHSAAIDEYAALLSKLATRPADDPMAIVDALAAPMPRPTLVRS